jgi:hypothetical protein
MLWRVKDDVRLYGALRTDLNTRLDDDLSCNLVPSKPLNCPKDIPVKKILLGHIGGHRQQKADFIPLSLVSALIVRHRGL